MKKSNGLTWEQASDLSKAEAAKAGQIPALVSHIFVKTTAQEVYDFTEGSDKFPQRIYVDRCVVDNYGYEMFLEKIATPNFFIVNDGTVRFSNKTKPKIGDKIFVEIDKKAIRTIYPFVFDEDNRKEYLGWFSSDCSKMGDMVYNTLSQ